ncbi:response regulator transcription factor [Pseudoflavitalea sp. G-6-1-2]|uniref:response regulator n=1 Tax=Pseudoflavitalea sp. G-6-1-2 TaxID=2728841 RepID=UPI00146EE99F|nr:response regulator transcription factor [Pseudoflavitalea sp. G-6-1-2]NML20084.1 response regulator transcription factor [Pseudoflavitalea sp. G-6-1-2]
MPDICHIAIVDDHTMFRKGLSALINMFPGYRVMLDAANGQDFIHQLQPPKLPNIVLLDISMPVMDGYATADWLRMHHPYVSILALSTMDSEHAIIRMIRHGARGYILKDADPAELKLAFGEVTKRGFYFNEAVSGLVRQAVGELIDNSKQPAIEKLTEREMVFIRQACSEKSYQQIADELGVSERTVDGYRESVFRKLKVSTRVGLVLYAVRSGMVKP